MACIAAVAFACLAVGLGGCGLLDADGARGSSWQPPYYEAGGFSQENGRIIYHEGSEVFAKTGVDVSEHQGYVDWNAVTADGIDFAIIRVGYRGTSEGVIVADAYAEYNLAASAEAGIQRGVYFFSQAVSVDEAREEAAFVLDFLGGASLEYPVVFDYEIDPEGVSSRTEDVTDEDAVAIAEAFCSAVEAGGYDAMLYGNASDLDRVYGGDLERYPLWYAEYGSYPTCRVPVMAWQYTSGGQVAGIDAAVDLSLDLVGAGVG